MTPQQFIAKWQQASLSERSACQQHFLDLCELLGQPKPAEADPEGAWYTFERGVQTTGGAQGWADVWMKGRFGWEYKQKHKDLKAAYDQLLRYREALENPPLLVVCDLDRFEIHTNFTGTAKQVHAFDLSGLAEPRNLELLRKLFTDPEALKPGETPESATERVAELIGQVADALRTRNVPPHDAAHFLMKLMFCMFAEDIDLLPEKLFSRVLKSSKSDPAKLAKSLRELITAMTEGGDFWGEDILHFNGGLFADADVIELRPGEIQKLSDASVPDWSNVEPSVFGTLFERMLDPDKRSQIGAHYTSRADIETLLEPVVMQPLRREWAAVKEKCDALLPKIREEARKQTKPQLPGKKAGSKKKVKVSKPRQDYDALLTDFRHRLAHVTILDPACGSGNFLYVALHLLLDLEKEVISYASRQGVTLLPRVRPTQLAGIEINPYAQELASVVIWIGYLQWMRSNGFNPPRNPVLEPIESIRQMDAILDLSDPEHPLEPEWPKAEFIVGNPPFLGGKLLRSNLSDQYVDRLFDVWSDRVRPEADICCYWFEKGRQQIERKRVKRVGLLATQGIRGGANRETLKRIKATGDIFWAVSDRDWTLDGAIVHVSMVGYDAAQEPFRVLDGNTVDTIHANLTATADTTQAKRIQTNVGISFMGDTKGGAFDISESLAIEMLQGPNPHGRPNSDVVVPWTNGLDVTRRSREMWIIDFGVSASAEVASHYEMPFEHVRQLVLPIRRSNKRDSYRERWWIHVEPRGGMRTAFQGHERFIATTTVSKHRLFVWMAEPTLPDHQLIVFAKSDDYFMGVLHSRPHEHWALSQGTQLREKESGFRYTPTTCFETFPFPEPTDAQREAIAAAAKELDELRQRWLNPPEWVRTEVLEFPGTVGGPWDRYIRRSEGGGQKSDEKSDPDAASVRVTGSVGTVRYPRLVAKDDECAKALKKRTLTNLYNERPTWLELAHRKLDEAVFAAYGWNAGISEDELLAKLLALNLERAGRE